MAAKDMLRHDRMGIVRVETGLGRARGPSVQKLRSSSAPKLGRFTSCRQTRSLSCRVSRPRPACRPQRRSSFPHSDVSQ
jgi:hypothetical protein